MVGAAVTPHGAPEAGAAACPCPVAPGRAFLGRPARLAEPARRVFDPLPCLWRTGWGQPLEAAAVGHGRGLSTLSPLLCKAPSCMVPSVGCA